jgi:hypothetical protein
MKNIFLITVMLMFVLSSSAFAQNKDQDKNVKSVPEKVKAEFAKAYPNVKDANWVKEEGVYEAKFTSGGTQMGVHINNDGKIIEKEKFIKFGDLPKTTQDYLNKNYPGQQFGEISEITKTSTNKNYYEVEAKNKELMFDNNGNFMNHKKEGKMGEGKKGEGMKKQ